MITIHWDFTDGSEVSYQEGLKLKDNFTTNCLDFFCFDTDASDIIILRSDGKKIIREKLLGQNPYTDKEIRIAHNIQKMLKANKFKFL